MKKRKRVKKIKDLDIFLKIYHFLRINNPGIPDDWIKKACFVGVKWLNGLTNEKSIKTKLLDKAILMADKWLKNTYKIWKK